MPTWVRYDADGIVKEVVQLSRLPKGRPHPFGVLPQGHGVLQEKVKEGAIDELRRLQRSRVDMGTKKIVAAPRGKKVTAGKRPRQRRAAGGILGPSGGIAGGIAQPAAPAAVPKPRTRRTVAKPVEPAAPTTTTTTTVPKPETTATTTTTTTAPPKPDATVVNATPPKPGPTG